MKSLSRLPNARAGQSGTAPLSGLACGSLRPLGRATWRSAIRKWAVLGAGCTACACLAITSARAVTISDTPNLAIPDNDINGVTDTINLSTPLTSITSLTVSLDIAGGWNGDYYAYLRHGATGFAVLLNRVGTPGNGGFGYGDSGLNITLSDGAPNGDVHTYQNVVNPAGGTLTGTWQPDGSSLASSFNGMDPNGAWTLFVADLSAVGTGTFVDWNLNIAGNGPITSLPDGGSTLAMLGFAVAALLGVHRFRPGARKV